MKRKPIYVVAAFVVIVISINACTKLEPQPPEADTVMDAPLDGMTQTQYHLFNVGADEFDEVYTGESGLGPVFVATSCGSCHTADNRGHMFTALTRFGQTDSTGNKFLDMGAPQIQNHAIQGHTAETLPAGATSSMFLAPIASGVGFLELVPDADIIAMANENNTNSDGVRGRPNWNTIPSFVTPFPNAISRNGKYICRFGKKGSTYNLLQQTVTALNQDMGITSTYMPDNPYNYLEGINSVPMGDPEITDNSVNAIVFYLQTLQTPFQRDQDNAEVKAGEKVFIQTGCESCHKQTLKTGYSPVSALSYKEFHPFTDLLLHDMGPGLDDGYTEGTAKTSEWRTPALWGLGLAKDAQGGKYFLLHDGRAHSIEEAILLHGGEATVSVNRFNALTTSDRTALIKFLKSL